MKLGWLTDPHLNFLPAEDTRRFVAGLAEGVDALVVTGDIAEAPSLLRMLELFDQLIEIPVYYVLGNHDYYGGRTNLVRTDCEAWSLTSRHTRWLPSAGVVRLTAETALVGHGGWGDGQYGDFLASPIMLNDYLRIADLVSPSREVLLTKLRDLGLDAASALRPHLEEAAGRFETVVVATHVPPFVETCWHEGEAVLNDWTPHFTCKAIGDLLLDVAARFPETHLLVLCGHTHGEGVVRILPNLEVRTGGAVYRAPALQPVLDFQRGAE